MIKSQIGQVPDLKIELERSDYINHRKELMKTLRIPKLSEAKAILGEPLANIVFDECDEALKVEFGLKPPLKGATGDLWVSPSDLLSGKVALKPPLTRKHIQALTHEGIINIGANVEFKFLNEAEADKERALAAQKKYMLDTFEDSTKAEIKDVEARERAAAQREIEKISQEFEIHLIEELDQLQRRLEAEFEYLNKNQDKIIQAKWEKKLEQEVQKTVNSMTEQFLVELSKHEEILTKHMELELSKAEVKRRFDLGTQAAQHVENMKHLKHDLECRNIANMMYILCMERVKCIEEKFFIDQYYRQLLAEDDRLFTTLDTKLAEKAKDLEKQTEEVKLRETCIAEILKQFQKFINFALKAAPTQAEFLLSVEKMMVFGLTDTLIKMEPPKPEQTPCEEYLQWCPAKKPTEPQTVEDIYIKDYHDCFNELTPPETPDAVPDYLAAFQYKNKLYVREDFRNMMSQGMRISSSSHLWSKDVEILIDVLRSSVHSFQEVKDEPDNLPQKSSSGNLKSNDPKLRTSSDNQQGAKKISLEKGSPLENRSLQMSQKYDKVSLKPMKEHSIVDYTKIGGVENKPFLLGTTSSIELTMKKYYNRTGSRWFPDTTDGPKFKDANVQTEDPLIMDDKISEDSGSLKIITDEPHKDVGETGSRNIVLEVRDSIVQNKISLMQKSNEFNADVRDSIEVAKDSSDVKVKRTVSRIASARDSLELLHGSKSRIKDSKPSCAKKEPKSISSGNSSRETCCDKCRKSIPSEEVLKDTILDKPRERSLEHEKAIKISNADEVNVMDNDNKSSVAFNRNPTAVSNDFGPDGLPQVYSFMDTQQTTNDKKKSNTEALVKKKPIAKVIGDRNAKEYQQKTYEFAEDRVNSLIQLIRDHPNLLRTFTACTR